MMKTTPAITHNVFLALIVFLSDSSSPAQSGNLTPCSNRAVAQCADRGGWTKMQERIHTAESEIHQRRLVLSQDHGGTDEERTALVNDMSGLRVLRMNIA
jgi:hypothetical protein